MSSPPATTTAAEAPNTTSVVEELAVIMSASLLTEASISADQRETVLDRLACVLGHRVLCKHLKEFFDQVSVDVLEKMFAAKRDKTPFNVTFAIHHTTL